MYRARADATTHSLTGHWTLTAVQNGESAESEQVLGRAYCTGVCM